MVLADLCVPQATACLPPGPERYSKGPDLQGWKLAQGTEEMEDREEQRREEVK